MQVLQVQVQVLVVVLVVWVALILTQVALVQVAQKSPHAPLLRPALA